MHQSRTRNKVGNVYPRPRRWCDPRGSRVFYLKDTTYHLNERYHMPPNEGIKH